MQPIPTSVADLVGTVQPGARPLPPRERGDQGVSPAEESAAARATSAMLAQPDVHAVLTMRDGAYEVRSATGLLRWTRLQNPDRSIAFPIVEQQGIDPIGSVDPIALGTLGAEIAAAGGGERPVPWAAQSTPDALRRLSQLFDSARAPDLVYLPEPGGVANTPERAGGAHGSAGILQSRAPVILAGPGIAAGAVRSLPGISTRDIAPTIAELLGVAPLSGAGAEAVRMKGQSGRSFAADVAAAGAGAGALDGIAGHALLVVWDGTSSNVLADELARGTLPNLARLQARGTTLEHGAIAEFPSMTWANHTSMVTGSEPGTHGILSNTWRDRATGDVFDPLDAKNKLRMFHSASALSPDVETLHDAIHRTFGPGARTVAMNEPAGRGADVATLEVAGVPTMLAKALAVRSGMQAIASAAPDDAAFAAEPGWTTQRGLDRFGSAMVAALVGGRGSAPKFAMLEQFLGDSMAHDFGPQSAAGRMALRVQDANLGLLIDGLERIGRLADTVVMVTADHGSEHQSPGDSARVRESIAAAGLHAHVDDRFVYLDTLDVSVGAPGAGGGIEVTVRNEDAALGGAPGPVRGAIVHATDAGGRELTTRTDRRGRARFDAASGGAGTISITGVEHPDFTAWTPVASS